MAARFSVHAFVGTGDDGALEILFALSHVLPFFVELPPVGVVLAGVQEFAVIAEAAEAGLFVAVFLVNTISMLWGRERIWGERRERGRNYSLLTNIRRHIRDGDCPDIARRLDGANFAIWRVRVLLDVTRLVRQALVCAVRFPF